MAENNENDYGVLTDTGNIVYVQDESFTRLYSNNAQFSMSLWDASLTFGETLGEKDGKVIVLQKLKVNMPKELAKVLMLIMEKNIGVVEDQFGEIKLPDAAVIEQLKTHIKTNASKTSVSKKPPKKTK